ncbi:MAG TPA: hypothetical protein VGB75_19940 [Jatrophihabitans sp.]|uniref:hypothetical protein n=1 Tax=Jatrophihabitans sp. TaxID=1932789 RepID=UPI002F1722E1
MTQAQDRPRRRRRPRPPAAEPAGRSSEAAGSGRGHGDGVEPDPATGRSAKSSRREDAGRGHGRDSERGWRELAGSSPSQVGLGGALRARDVARPTAAELAAAERDVVVVRRNWQPPEA